MEKRSGTGKTGKERKETMEQYEQITLDQWLQWKEDIRRKLEETAGNFVHIGYRLKQIRDSGMYDGAENVFKFAAREFGLSKSTVSRFIAINEKYSEGGNSLELKAEFRGFSSSKLSEMLTLPDSEIQLITEKTTVREIRELRDFNSQEPAAEDLAEEGPAAAGDKAAGPLERCLEDFFRTRRDMLNSVMQRLDAKPAEYKEAAELMAPSGQASHRKGIVFLFLYDWNTGVKYKLMTATEPVAMGWKEFLDTVRSIYNSCCRPDIWGDFYREREGGKEEGENAVPARSNQGKEAVATSQQNDMEEPAKIWEDTEAENMRQPQDAAAETKKPVEVVAKEAQPEPEEQLPGKMEIMDYTEAMPESSCVEAAEEPAEEAQAEEPPEAAGVPERPGDGENPCDSESADGLEEKPEEVPEQKENMEKAPELEGDLIWMEFESKLSYLKKWATVWNYKDVPSDCLIRAYHTAIDMAASIERILAAKGVKNG